MSNHLDPLSNPLNIETIQEIDNLDLPIMQKHHLRILAHCLQILKFINEDICVGVKQQGGMISHLRNEVEVLCSAASLPEFIEIDTQNIELNQSVMMSEISLPEGVELTSVLNDLQDQPVLSCSVTRASLEIDDDPVIGEDGEEVTDDAEASADSSQTDESQEEESNDN